MEIEKTTPCRCRWCNLKNPIYVKYHDEEWGIPTFDDQKLFELLLLEPFQAGLSWETILTKREAFRSAFDNFDAEQIRHYDESRIEPLLQNCSIIRNRRKIEAAIVNAGVFMEIQAEWGSFSEYIWHFTNKEIIYETDQTHSDLSDQVTADMKKRGMKFIGTTTVYAYLQAIGVIYSHDRACFLYKE